MGWPEGAVLPQYEGARPVAPPESAMKIARCDGFPSMSRLLRYPGKNAAHPVRLLVYRRAYRGPEDQAGTGRAHGKADPPGADRMAPGRMETGQMKTRRMKPGPEPGGAQARRTER